ncbi:MAG: SufE family protein [Verrucomicrobia bacterium]|nr:SufE family protein [Verrucomicrobiota bacterium]MCH8526803.1 SufE family protein [Kiritimatiellia bacterium]
MSSITDRQNEIRDEFAFFEDWQEKYAHIIELGRELPKMNPAYKDDAHKVKGCQSQVWLHADLSDEGRVALQAESDALIVQGLIAILLRIYQDQPPQDILNTDLTFLEDVGLLSHLSMNRTNGLNSMIKTIRANAAAFAAQK